jgi:gluconokinase
MVIVLMGAAGAGKTTVGRALAAALGWPFVDADDLHDARSVARMRSGTPLEDEHRRPWLERVHQAMLQADRSRHSIVVACSALREEYRAQLARDVTRIAFVFLDASPALLRDRLERRVGHFMPPSLVDSQLEILEPPRDGIRIEAAQPVDAQVQAVRVALGL